MQFTFDAKPSKTTNSSNKSLYVLETSGLILISSLLSPSEIVEVTRQWQRQKQGLPGSIQLTLGCLKGFRVFWLPILIFIKIGCLWNNSLAASGPGQATPLSMPDNQNLAPLPDSQW
ncbi:hypothetical protein QQP08_011943 [Theobroma cacao]|nr:hypothetical protein QQP08_011943 [Theobroma cacao]